MRRRHNPIALRLAWLAGVVGFLVVVGALAWHDGLLSAIGSGLMIMLLFGGCFFWCWLQ